MFLTIIQIAEHIKYINMEAMIIIFTRLTYQQPHFGPLKGQKVTRVATHVAREPALSS